MNEIFVSSMISPNSHTYVIEIIIFPGENLGKRDGGHGQGDVARG